MGWMLLVLFLLFFHLCTKKMADGLRGCRQAGLYNSHLIPIQPSDDEEEERKDDDAKLKDFIIYSY